MSNREPPHDPGDDELLAVLAREAARLDPPPEALFAAGRDSYAWRRVDTDLAELLRDSLDESRIASGIRGSPARFLTFEAPDVVVQLEVEPAGRRDRLRIVGQLGPGQPARIEAVRPDGASIGVDVDAAGRFVIDDLPDGPVRLRCVPPAPARAVETAWFTI